MTQQLIFKCIELTSENNFKVVFVHRKTLETLKDVTTKITLCKAK